MEISFNIEIKQKKNNHQCCRVCRRNKSITQQPLREKQKDHVTNNKQNYRITGKRKYSIMFNVLVLLKIKCSK